MDRVSTRSLLRNRAEGLFGPYSRLLLLFFVQVPLAFLITDSVAAESPPQASATVIRMHYESDLGGTDRSATFIKNVNDGHCLTYEGLTSGISLHLDSKHVRLSGAMLEIYGRAFDESTKTLYHVHGMASLSGPWYATTNVPNGHYRLTITQQSQILYAESVAVRGRTSIPIEIPAPSEYSGTIQGPPRASEPRPIVRCGPAAVGLGDDHRFTMRTFLQPTDRLSFVFFQPSNPDGGEVAARSLTRVTIYAPGVPQAGKIHIISVPGFTTSRAVIGRLVPPLSLSQVHQDLSTLRIAVDAVSEDGNLVVEAVVDRDGRFSLSGLPDGAYRLQGSEDPDCAPFEMVPIRFQCIQEAPQIFEIPLSSIK